MWVDTVAMTKMPKKFHDNVPELLADAGFGPDMIDALLDLDGTMFLWHRASSKGEVPAKILAELGSSVEVGQFYAMTAIFRIQEGVGRDIAEPATIGLLAEEMNIDPSRASRVASDLIAKGLVRREAAQDDGRKSILVLTETADALFRAYKELKWAKVIEVYRDWNAEDIAAFSRLLGRYVGDMRRVLHGQD